ALRAEGRVQEEAARTDVQHLGPVTDDDQRTLARLQDAIDALAQRRTRRHGRERGEELGAGAVHHTAMVVRGPRPPCQRPRATGPAISRRAPARAPGAAPRRWTGPAPDASPPAPRAPSGARRRW